MQITWFRQPAGDDPGSLNLCFHAVDIAVIRGAAPAPAVLHSGGALDYATLLEQVAALAGAMRGLGVVPGAPVGVLLDEPLDELLAVLATARLGAVVVALDPDDPAALLDVHRPGLVVTSRRLDLTDPLPSAVLLQGPEVEVETRDLAWDMALRAGRTDPAPCAPVSPEGLAYIGTDEVAVIDVPGHQSMLGQAVSSLADRVPVDLTGAHP
ncbi:MAG: AMP-binding protein [Nocardioides sp.]